MCQFTDQDGRDTLAGFVNVPGVYPAGRLDYDSEGLVLLTDDGELKARIAHPRHGVVKRYLVQVEGLVTDEAVDKLLRGVSLKDGPARAVSCRMVDEPAGLWQRVPPIRERKAIPTSWLELELKEGRNRQVRRMTAAVGLPTLRLIRTRIGSLELGGLQPGEFREVGLEETRRAFGAPPARARRPSAFRGRR